MCVCVHHGGTQYSTVSSDNLPSYPSRQSSLVSVAYCGESASVLAIHLAMHIISHTAYLYITVVFARHAKPQKQ